MKFTVNTKPLIDALDIGIINANISNYHKKSNVAQVTATEHVLKINLEADNIKTQLTLKGSGDTSDTSTIFVSSAMLKQLIASLDTVTVTFEFADSGLVIHSGKSTFTLAKMTEADDIELAKPALPKYDAVKIDIDKTKWKFIKDNQMYALAMSFIHPVYTRVWVGADGDVLVGDFDNSLFTHSKGNTLGTQCLLSDTIINLFISLPDDAKLIKLDRSYLVIASTEGFEYITEFSPLYETDEGIGDYNSDIFLDMMKHSSYSVKVSSAKLNKILGQASMLSNTVEDTIKFVMMNNVLTLTDNNVNCDIDVTGESVDYQIEFKIEALRKVMSTYSDETISIAPVNAEDGSVGGIQVWNDALTTVVAGVE